MFKHAGFKDECREFVDSVQAYRNAIHAYKDRDIGDKQIFLSFVKKYYYFIKEIHISLPYPDGCNFTLS